MTHGLLHYDSERLSSFLYNPIDNSSVSNQYFFYELDPDQQFTFSPPPSNYYTEDKINAKLTNTVILISLVFLYFILIHES